MRNNSVPAPHIGRHGVKLCVSEIRQSQRCSPKNIVDADLWYWLRIRYLPLLATDVPQITAVFLNPPKPALTIDQRSGDRQLALENIMSEKERIRRNHIAPKITSYPEESPAMADAYREMLALCREKGWRVVLVTPPYLAVYRNLWKSSTLYGRNYTFT